MVFALMLSACGRREEGVRHYAEVGGPPLEEQPAGAGAQQNGMPPMMAAMMQGAADAPKLDWKTPEGWTEKAGGGPIVVSFAAGGADCALIAFPAMMAAAPVEQKIGIWLQQIGAEPPSQEALVSFIAKPQKLKSSGGFDCEMYDFADLLGPSVQSSLLAALFAADGKSLAVRMKGPPAALVAQKQNFIAFLQSLRKKE